MLHQSPDNSAPVIVNWSFYLRWSILLIFAPFFAHSNSLMQGHFLPKIGILALLSVAMAIILFLRVSVWLPHKGVLFGIVAWLALSVLSGALAVSPWQAYLNTGVIFSAVILFFFLLNIQRKTKRLLPCGIIATGLAQFLTLIVVPLGLSWNYTPFDAEGRWFGTLGNSEFLATLLGAGVFCSLHLMRLTNVRWQKTVLIAAIVVLMFGLVLTHNKGALILIGAYLLWRTSGRRLWPWLLLGIAIVGAAFLLPSAVLGRVFLLITGVEVFVTHPLFGVGTGQLSNHYIEAVQNIFSYFPTTVVWFGAHTASVRDVHNLPLSLGLELGIGGFLLGGLLLWYGFRLCRPLRHPLRGGLAFLLIKSLYTVVITSGTGAILLAIFLSATIPPRWMRRTSMPLMVGAGQLAVALHVMVLTCGWIVSDWHLHRGIKFLAFGELNLARVEIKEALKVNPEHAEAWLSLGKVEFLDKETDSMGAALDKAVFFMRDMDTYKKSAHMYFFRKEYQRSLLLYSYLLKAYPQHLTSMARIVQIHEATGDHASAITMAEMLLRTAPRVPSNSDLRNILIARTLLGK